MLIPFTEPVAPRYIHINPETNRVHLMVPVVSGQEISTDNTCKATVTLRQFFDGGALRELNTYKDALELDIQLIEEGNPQLKLKEERLTQIHAYIEAAGAMRNSYSDAMTALMKRPVNLYSIQLRPRAQDSQSRVENPAFNIERKNDGTGIPLSALYRAMHSIFSTTVIAALDPQTRLTTAVLAALPLSPTVADIQRILSEQSQSLFGLAFDFTQQTNGTKVDKEAIDDLMGFNESTPATSYMYALLGMCAPNIGQSIPTPPFYSIPQSTSENERTENLSILTQFFMANVTIYCKARGISNQNFGAILDASTDLSNELVSIVATGLSAGDEVEEKICAFCNGHATELGLSRPLIEYDIRQIKQKFTRTYRTVTATKENPHMDDFMILDKDVTGETAKFVTHQGAICTNFAEIVDLALPSQDYFAIIRKDFANHLAEIPPKNECVAGEIDVEIETLLKHINDEQFKKLPQTVIDACRAHPNFYLRQFLHDVAKGKEVEAKALLTTVPANTQILLRTPGVFTDYSGRTFNCTAYEYAYWAKDTHMCRMLENLMDPTTKALLLERVDEMERIDSTTGLPIGLVYQQNGSEHRSAHFDLTPLKDALNRYVNGFTNRSATPNSQAITEAWKDIGKAQRNVPAHVAQEYCRPDRSFSPTPDFNEEQLPRGLEYKNFNTGKNDSWFPLSAATSIGLGFDCALLRAGGRSINHLGGSVRLASIDLAAVNRLDEVRTADLGFSRNNLNPSANSQSISISDFSSRLKQ